MLIELVAVLAAGSTAMFRAGDGVAGGLRSSLPEAVQARIAIVDEPDDGGRFSAALAHGDADFIAALSRDLARRAGPIVTLQGAAPHLAPARCYDIPRLMLERSVSINTAAAGGNASLMTLAMP